MNRLFRSTQLALVTALAFLALTGCQVDSENSPFAHDSGASSNSNHTDSSTSEPGELRSVSLYWSAPSHRINNDQIAIEELGGYEVRYRKADEASYTRIVIEDPLVEQYHIDDLAESDYVFEVAAFDKDGLYSDFVAAVR